MSDGVAGLARRLVIGRKRDGRSIYDAQAKHELILAAREPGVSMAKLARECGVNANQLSSWVRQYEREIGKTVLPTGAVVEVQASTFVPVQIDATGRDQAASSPGLVGIQARLANGVVVDLRGCDTQQACSLIEALGSLRCSASMKS